MGPPDMINDDDNSVDDMICSDPVGAHSEEEREMTEDEHVAKFIEEEEAAEAAWWNRFRSWDHPFPQDIYGTSPSEPYHRIREMRHDLNVLIFCFEESTGLTCKNLQELDAIYLLRSNLTAIQKTSGLTPAQSKQLSQIIRQGPNLKEIDKKFRRLHSELLEEGILDRSRSSGRRRRRGTGRAELLATPLPPVIASDSITGDIEEEVADEDAVAIETFVEDYPIEGLGYCDDDEDNEGSSEENVDNDLQEGLLSQMY